MRRELILPVTDEASLMARRALNAAIPPPDLRERFDDARLAISEIATNAVVHARLHPERDVIRLVMEADDDRVRIEVEQPTPATDVHPVEPRTDPAHPGGYGLHLVEAMADDWGVAPGPPGVVWFEFRRGEPPS